MNVWGGVRQALPGADDTPRIRRHSSMKFRFVLLPDDDRDGHPPARKDAAAVDHSTSRTLWYEQRGTEMVRVEQLPSGARKCTPIANFTARIVTDMIRDDGEEQRRDFRVEAEVDGQRLVFDVAAAEFGRVAGCYRS